MNPDTGARWFKVGRIVTGRTRQQYAREHDGFIVVGDVFEQLYQP
jgi:hypothetical protein